MAAMWSMGDCKSWPERPCSRQWDDPPSPVWLGNALSRWTLLEAPTSTSFKVAAKRITSNSLSPELCTESKRTVRPRSETLLKSSQDMLAGSGLLGENPRESSCEIKNSFEVAYQSQVFVNFMTRFTDEQVKETKSLVFENFCYSGAEGFFQFSLLIHKVCCKSGPSPYLFCTFPGHLVTSLAWQVWDVCLDFLGKLIAFTNKSVSTVKGLTCVLLTCLQLFGFQGLVERSTKEALCILVYMTIYTLRGNF